MTTKQAVVITILIVSMITAMSFGCSFDKYARVSGGDYVPIDPGSLHDDIGVNLIKSISVDRDGQIIKIDLEDGSIIDTRFTSRPREDWPSGCPANIGSTKMEVLDLHADTLNIGSLVFNDPILVRDCPPTPEIIVLREDGPIGGSGTACAGNYSCIPFKPGTPLEPLQSPRALTDEEKDIVIQIAISSPEVESYLEQDSSFETELKWVARLSEETGAGTLWQIDYDWKSDNSFSSVPEPAIWHPGVLLQFNEPDYAELLVAVDMYEESIVYVHENPDATGTIELAQGLLDIDGRIKEAQLLNNGLPARIMVELDKSAERKLNLISSKINKPPIFRGLILSNLASFFGGEGGTVPELLFEKKRLIPALQQLLVSS